MRIRLKSKFAIGLGLSLISTLVLAGCLPSPKPKTPPSSSTITVTEQTSLSPDELATALIDEIDVLGLLFGARPMMLEFNDGLEPSLAEVSEFYIARLWLDEISGDDVLQTAITKYDSVELAQQSIIDLAGQAERIKPEVELGDTRVVYFNPADETYPADITYRFTVGQYGVRISALDIKDDAFDTDAEIRDYLSQQANNLAQVQYEKLMSVLTAPVVEIPTNVASDNLPETIPGGQELGTTVITGEQWLGTTYDLDSSEFVGFKSGAMRRWQIVDRPGEVVEITVMELETSDQATAMVGQLLSTEGATELAVPEALAATSKAIDRPGIVELQSAQGNYLIDVAIFAPFTDIDQTAAQVDLNTISETVLVGFEL